MEKHRIIFTFGIEIDHVLTGITLGGMVKHSPIIGVVNIEHMITIIPIVYVMI